MSTVYNKQDLLNHLQQIIPNGYSMNKHGQFLKRDDQNDRTIMLSFGIRERFPFGANFFGFGVGVTFHQVEEILHNVYQNHPNLAWGHDLDSNTFYRGFANRVLGRQFIIENVDNVKVENDATFAQVQPYLQQMIDAAIAFLSTNQTLQQFYDFGGTMEPRDNAGFYGQNSPPKRLIIRKLLGIPYDSLANQYINKYVVLNYSTDAAFYKTLKII